MTRFNATLPPGVGNECRQYPVPCNGGIGVPFRAIAEAIGKGLAVRVEAAPVAPVWRISAGSAIRGDGCAGVECVDAGAIGVGADNGSVDLGYQAGLMSA